MQATKWLAAACVFIVACGAAMAAGKDPGPPEPPASQPGAAADKPLTYHDAATGITLYVETNRHIISAIGPDGAILWHQDMADKAFGKPGGRMYVDLKIDGIAALAPAMKADPRAKGDHLAAIFLSFGNTQNPGRRDDGASGVIDLKTGRYTEISFRTTNTLQ